MDVRSRLPRGVLARGVGWEPQWAGARVIWLRGALGRENQNLRYTRRRFALAVLGRGFDSRRLHHL